MEDTANKRLKIDDEYPESSQFQVESSANKALRNPLIVENILSRLTNNELKQVRGVNKYWRGEASHILIKRDCLRLHFQFETNDQKYKLAENNIAPKNIRQVQEQNQREDKDKLLVELIDMLENSGGQFPCTDFIFTGGDLISDGASEFFSTYGRTIKTLILNGVSPLRETIQQMLSRQIPNVRKLSVDFYYPVMSDSSWKLVNLCLPLLSVLNFGKEMHLDGRRRKIAQDIVGYGANSGTLESVGNFPIKDVSPEFWIEYGRFMKDFNWLPSSSIGDLITFSAFKPALKSVSILEVKPHRLPAPPPMTNHELKQVAKLLFSSQKSLKLLQWKSLGSIPKVQFLNVTHLTLHLNTKPEDKFDGALIKKLFPALKSISLELERASWVTHQSAKWDRYFNTPPSKINNSQIIFENVEELEVTKGVPKKWWRNFHGLFPNVKILRFDELPTKITKVFRLWNNLEQVICGSFVFCRPDTPIELSCQCLNVLKQNMYDLNQRLQMINRRLDVVNERERPDENPVNQVLAFKPDPPSEPKIFTL